MSKPNVVAPARAAAFRILCEVESTSAHADDLLRARSVNKLSAADRNLTTALVLGVLRWQIALDHALNPLLKRPGGKLDVPVRTALRLAAFQLSHMERIPAHAAIGESVELVKQAGHRFAAGMVNAVLRRFGAESHPTASHLDSVDLLALSHAHPAWMVRRWVAHYGAETAETICHHGQRPPSTTLRLSQSADEPQLSAAGLLLAPSQLIGCARHVVGGEIAVVEATNARIQDEGSQLIAELAAAAMPGAHAVLDCCAAPGGKTLILAERLRQARIVAWEQSEQRLMALRNRLSELGDRVEFVCGDAADLMHPSIFDLVLADVPCSGSGTLGRNPEIRHRIQPTDLERQSARQRSILTAALQSVCVGGRVVYSTCSLESEENENVVAAVLGEMPGARVISLADSIESLSVAAVLRSGIADTLVHQLSPEGWLTLLPGVFGTDGFFVALLERTN